MGFIDKKSRVIDLVLTTYGKELMSKGLLSGAIKYFALGDTEIQYVSSSADLDIEAIPVLEPLSDNIDELLNNRILDSELFVSNYPKVSISSTSSIQVERFTDSSFDSDPIMSIALSPDSIVRTVSIAPRVSSLASLGSIRDVSASIAFERDHTEKKPRYLITLEVSSSDQRYPLYVSGSSFGVSSDPEGILQLSSEYETANTFYPIVSVNKS